MNINEINSIIGRDVDKEKDRINIKPVEKRNNKNRDDIDVIDTKSNYNDGKVKLPTTFVNRLMIYIDNFFPTSSELSDNISVELRKNGIDIKELDKSKKRIRDIIYKEKMKMLDRINSRCQSILVNPK